MNVQNTDMASDVVLCNNTQWLKGVDSCCKAPHRTAYKHLIYIYVSFRYLDDTSTRKCSLKVYKEKIKNQDLTHSHRTCFGNEFFS